jgi:nitroreductase
MKSFIELARKRASIRAFRDQPVPEELLQRVLEAGRIAPSACNFQPWHFIVVRAPGQLDKLSESYKRDWFRSAPVVIAICVDKDKAWSRRSDHKSYAEVDAAIAIDHMTLCAADNDLGTCWIAAFKPEVVRDTLGLPESIEPIALLPLGWPDEIPTNTPRKEMNEVIRYDKW